VPGEPGAPGLGRTGGWPGLVRRGPPRPSGVSARRPRAGAAGPPAFPKGHGQRTATASEHWPPLTGNPPDGRAYLIPPAPGRPAPGRAQRHGQHPRAHPSMLRFSPGTV